uniref:Si:ch211-76l23.4 n=2 Tax=Callorhinchus milii TaxID=7868 RepID=V9L9D6_CALMI
MLCRFFVFLVSSLILVNCKKKTVQYGEWNYKDGSDKVDVRGVANLTQVLDNWRFDIMAQFRNLLLNDHQALLPDYARISPLSEALDDLFKEFNALKEHLGDLSEKFVDIEGFVDEMKSGKLNDARVRLQRPNGVPPRQKQTPPKKKATGPKKKAVENPAP